MASKSVFQKYNTDALDHYDLANDPKYGVIAGSNIEDVLVTEDELTYETIKGLLSNPTETDQTFVNKKKAFILPGCPVSNERLKPALKEHGITVTNDYTLADLIIGHDDFHDRFENGETIKTTMLLYKLWNYETTSGANVGGGSIDKLIKGHTNHVLVTPKVTNQIRYYDLDIEDSVYDSWVITGLALNIAWDIEQGSKSVVDVDTVLHTSASKQDLTPELSDQIIAMWNAGGDDRAVAQALLPTLKYDDNYHLLWNLTQRLGTVHYSHHNKDLNYWLKQCNWEGFYNRDAQNMVLWLEEEGKLNSKNFRYLEPIVRREITIHNRDLYVFQVAVKKQYRKYLKNEKEISN